MLPRFISYVSGLSSTEVRDWLINGFTRCRTDGDDGHPARPAMAFTNARLSFGQHGDQRTAGDELAALYELLPEPSKLVFQNGLADAIDALPIESKTMGVFDDLVELALDTKCNKAIDVLTAKLNIPREDARRSVFLHVAFFFDESDSPKAVLRLAKAMLHSGQYPPEISARLLVALCRYDVRSAAKYAEALRDPLSTQVEFLKGHSTGYERFRREFATSILQAPDKSKVVQALLGMPLYSKLLSGYVAGSFERLPGRSSRFILRPLASRVKAWAIDFSTVCAAAARVTYFAHRSCRSEETLAAIDRDIEHMAAERLVDRSARV